MKEELHSEFYQSLLLITQFDDKFLELASLLRQVREKSPQNFKTLTSIPQLGRRKAYYLLSIDKAFGDKNVPSARLKKIGWTKLAALAPHITKENLEDGLSFAELHTVRNIEAVVHGVEPILDGRTVVLNFTAEQFTAYTGAILANGAVQNGAGFVGAEAALIDALGKSSG